MKTFIDPLKKNRQVKNLVAQVRKETLETQ